MPEPPAGEDVTITRRAGLVALGTLSSRVLGAVRDAVIAASFPLASTDAFFVAWTIPNTLRQVLGEGAVSAAFIPIFSGLDEQQGRAAAQARC
jgi:putative peptidoglycan lipid II flippase